MELKGKRKKQHTEVKFTQGGSVRNVSILSFGYAMPELRQKHAALSRLGFKVLSHSDFQTVRALVYGGGQKFGFLLIGPTVADQE